ncbi:MAG: flagellar basal body P-ring formation protein FlgA [Myxococcales bacterium]|nr:flagellar basal body P-ring formation protein FlgA [Myxococcales bacterium]
MKRASLSISLILVLAAVNVAAAGAVPGMKTRVSVNEDNVYLTDIVDIAGDPALARKLGRNVLVRAPEVGASLRLDADFLRRRLRRAGVDDEALLAAVPAEVLVERRALTVEAAQVRALVEKQLRSWGGWREGSAEIEVPWNEDIVLPAGKLSYRTRPLGEGDLVGTVRVGIDFEIDGAAARTLWVPAHVHVYDDVVIVTTSVRRGATLTLGDLSTRRADLGAIRGEVFHDPSEVVGRRTRASLEPGSVLHAQALDMPPAVQRGALVNLLIDAPTIRISTLGEAQQRGAVGELIRVENIASGKTVFGEIVDGSTVRVKF